MLFAQSRTDFEVASIRPHAPPFHTIMGLKISGPRATLEAYNVQQLVQEAYGLRGGWQISWAAFPGRDKLREIYYDIAARASGAGTLGREEFRQMLRAL